MATAKKKTRRALKKKRFALYWCTTPRGEEDWFVVAESAAAARKFHENAEGFNRGAASAERIMALPPALLLAGAWRNGPKGENTGRLAGRTTLS